MSILSEGKSFLLKRSRVMIMEQDNKNKFIILEKIETDAAKFFYICPNCSNIKFNSYLSGKVQSTEFKACVHSRLCYLLWGDTANPDDVKNDDKEVSDLVEVVTENPRYLAVVHPARNRNKGAGVVTLTSKMLKPKCLVCKGQDKCIHLTIHSQQYKRGLEMEDGNDAKRIRVERPQLNKKPEKNNCSRLDPYQHDGPEANVFNIKIDFFQEKEISRTPPFNQDLFIPSCIANKNLGFQLER